MHQVQVGMFFFFLFIRQEILDPPMSAVRDEPEVLVPEKKSESARKQPFVGAPARVGHDMTTFLQKLREATKPKPSW